MAGKDSSWDDIKNEGVDLVSIFSLFFMVLNAYHFGSNLYFEMLISGLILFKQEKIPIEEVLTQLRCTREGLTTEEGHTRLEIFGPNKLEEKKAKTLFHFGLFLQSQGNTYLT